MRSIPVRPIGLLGTALALALGALPASAEFSPAPVRTTDAFEVSPAAGNDGINDLLAWSQNSRRRPRHLDAFVKVNGDPADRVNPRGTSGFAGGFDGDSFIYQQANRRDSDIKIYDVGTGQTSNPGSGINDRNWQAGPTLSGDWVLFAENRFAHADSPWKVFLVNIATDERRLLDQATFRCFCIFPGQVSGNYATWTECKGDNCDVHIHDILANDSDLIPNPNDKYQYEGVPDPNGTVFLARAGPRCGQNVTLVRYSLGASTPTLLYSLPDNKDVFVDSRMYLYSGGGGEDLLFSRLACDRRGNRADIFEIEGADGPVPSFPTRIGSARTESAPPNRRGIPLGAMP
jgi:hypothetical protein